MTTGEAVEFVQEVAKRLADEPDYLDELVYKFLDLLEIIDPDEDQPWAQQNFGQLKRPLSKPLLFSFKETQ